MECLVHWIVCIMDGKIGKRPSRQERKVVDQRLCLKHWATFICGSGMHHLDRDRKQIACNNGTCASWESACNNGTCAMLGVCLHSMHKASVAVSPDSTAMRAVIPLVCCMPDNARLTHLAASPLHINSVLSTVDNTPQSCLTLIYDLYSYFQTDQACEFDLHLGQVRRLDWLWMKSISRYY